MAGKIEIFTMYQHDRLNETGDSPVAGVMEGASIMTSFDGLHNLLAAKISLRHRGYRGSVSVLGGSHNTKPLVYPVVGGTGDFLYTEGGSVSVLGGSHNTKPSVYPVVGGTGDFLYTERYVRSSPVDRGVGEIGAAVTDLRGEGTGADLSGGGVRGGHGGGGRDCPRRFPYPADHAHGRPHPPRRPYESCRTSARHAPRNTRRHAAPYARTARRKPATAAAIAAKVDPVPSAPGPVPIFAAFP
uniref:Dirigent protein n=1 Tax=Zea mays TaxID=4577 RepID=A0A804U5V0_MAIZE